MARDTKHIYSFSIKGKSVRSWKYANIDVTTSYITAPQAAIDAVVQATGAEYDFKTDSYQVDCDKRGSFPDMVFNLPGMEYHLPAVDYARRVGLEASSYRTVAVRITAVPCSVPYYDAVYGRSSPIRSTLRPGLGIYGRRTTTYSGPVPHPLS